MTNVCEQLRAVVEEHSQQTALCDEAGELTYAKLWRETNAFAGAIREYGVRAGDVVAIAPELDRNAIIALLGTLRNGSVVLPLPEYEKSALTETLTACEPVILVAAPDRNRAMYLAEDVIDFRCRVITGTGQFGIDFDTFVGNTETQEQPSSLWERISRLGPSTSEGRPGLSDYWEVIDRAPTDPAVLGRIDADEPQYAVYTHEQVLSSIDAANTASGLHNEDVLVSTIPPTSIEAIVTVLGTTLFGGSTLSIPSSSEPAAFNRTIDAHGVTTSLTTPAQLEHVLEATSSLQSVGVVGPTPSSEQLQTIDTELGATAFQLVSLPGGAGISHGTFGDDSFEPDSIGKPLPDVRTRILDGGECPRASSAASPEADAIGRCYLAGNTITERAIDGQLNGVDREGTRWTDTGLEAYRTESGHCYVRGGAW